MGQKPNGSTPTLDARIAAARASDHVNKAELVSLLAEAEGALDLAEKTIALESERALDLANPDPDECDVIIRKAERTVTRLQKAIPQLRDRIRSIEAYEYSLAWDSEAAALQDEDELLGQELPDLYLGFLEQITDWYKRADALKARIDALHARAPAAQWGDQQRRLLDPELVARGIDRYDAVHPRLRDNLKLPDFVQSSTIAFPPNPMDQWNRYAAQSHAAMAQRMAEKGALATGNNWHAGRDLQIEHEESEHAKRAEELKQQELESRAAFERKLLEDDKRRRTGETK
jgi:hypothetical protein